jgi:methionyl-tRNA formyltransferase
MTLRIVWLSANLFGYELLKEALNIKEVDVVAIVTLSDKAKTKMYDGINKNKWHEFSSPVYEIEDINREIALLGSLRPDIVMMCGWRQILSKDVLNLPRLGVIGFHPTLLPKGRGPAPIINTIFKGFKESGVTMFYAAEKVDSGDIIGQESFEIKNDNCSMDVYNKVIEAGKTLIKKYLPLLAESKAPRIPQNEAEATYLEKRGLKDNEIKLETENPEEIYRKIRAFSKPYKGAYIKLGNKKLIIWKAELGDVDEG